MIAKAFNFVHRLSRRRRGFESRWGRQVLPFLFNRLKNKLILIINRCLWEHCGNGFFVGQNLLSKELRHENSSFLFSGPSQASKYGPQFSAGAPVIAVRVVPGVPLFIRAYRFFGL